VLNVTIGYGFQVRFRMLEPCVELRHCLYQVHGRKDVGIAMLEGEGLSSARCQKRRRARAVDHRGTGGKP
jgi:hypothetical protein